MVLPTQHCQVSHRRAEKQSFASFQLKTTKPSILSSQSQEPLCNAHFVNLLPSSFTLGVCNKTASFDLLHSPILQLIRSKSCKWKIKHQNVPCTLTPFTSKLLPCPFTLLALSSLRPLLPFHVTRFTVPLLLQYFPHFPSLAGS